MSWDEESLKLVKGFFVAAKLLTPANVVTLALADVSEEDGFAWPKKARTAAQGGHQEGRNCRSPTRRHWPRQGWCSPEVLLL